MRKGFSQAKNGTGLSLFAKLLLAGQFIPVNDFPGIRSAKFEKSGLQVFEETLRLNIYNLFYNAQTNDKTGL